MTISDEDYQELKAHQHDLNPEGKAAVREYELLNPQHIATGALGASGVTKLRETEPEEQKVNVPELPSEKRAAQPADKFKAATAPYEALSTPTDWERTHNAELPNASKLPVFDAPPEYTSPNALRHLEQVALATAKDPLDGPTAGEYYEPSKAQFEADMGDVLRAKGIRAGTPHYEDAYAEYADRKWQQAYQKAVATDTPLTRVAYAPRSGAWAKLGDFLDVSPDIASTFAKGFAAGGTLHATQALESDADQEQAERNPGARAIGEIAGSMMPSGLLAKVTKGAGSLAAKVLPGTSLLGRVVTSGIAGAVAADTDLAARSAAEGVRSGDVDTAKNMFFRNLLGSTVTGGAAGLGGGLVAEGANWFQKGTNSEYPEIAQLRRGGGDTDLLIGVKPGPDVAANLEAAREPLPGENKPIPQANATEIAAAKVQGPLADINAKTHADTRAQVAGEQQAMYESDPKLQERVPATKTAQAAVDWALSKLQPDAREGYLPGITRIGSADQLPGADMAEVQKIAPRLWKPRLVTVDEVGSIANRARGKAITLDEARAMGFPVSDLAKQAGGETGVPAGAPPIPDEPFNVAKELPRYPKDVLANATAAADATPEEADAIRRYTFGKRNAGDEKLIDQFLEKAPVSPLPHVYRGLVMPAEEAQDFLANGTFSIGDKATSVSADPITARSFVARNLNNPGDVGITLKLEHSSARDIQPYADPQVSVEKELLLPKNSTFEIVRKTPDPTNPGNWIVVAKEVPPDVGGGSTVEDVFGRSADKLESKPGTELGPRPGRAANRPAPEPGSDWDNPDEQRARFAYMYDDVVGYKDTHVPKPDDVTPTRVSNARPEPPPRGETVTPSDLGIGRPSEPSAPRIQAPEAAAIGGIPESEYRIILEPKSFDAKDFEEMLGDIDRKAKAGVAGADPDPAWKQLQRAIREDRQQFGSRWTDLIAKHHELLNQVEQRSAHAGLVEAKPYSEMQASSQAALNKRLVDFPGGTEAQKALRQLAANDPQVAKDLEVLGAQNAYSKLRGVANPRIGETLGQGGLTGHLRGLGPSVRFRADALARGISAGPTGEPTVSPKLVDFVRSQRSKFLPGLTSMGGGALGLKAGVGYNSRNARGKASQTLTPEDVKFLQGLLEH